jgi:hypothetical protein
MSRGSKCHDEPGIKMSRLKVFFSPLFFSRLFRSRLSSACPNDTYDSALMLLFMLYFVRFC